MFIHSIYNPEGRIKFVKKQYTNILLATKLERAQLLLHLL